MKSTLCAIAVAAAFATPALAQQIVKIDGSSTVFPVTEAVAEDFQKAKKQKVKVTVGISGTGGGFKKFCRGETDIADASRPILEEGDGGVQGGRHRVHRAAGGLRRADGRRQPEEHLRQAADRRRDEEDVGAGRAGQGDALEPDQPGVARPADEAVRAGRGFRHVRLLHRGRGRQVQVLARRLHRLRGRQRPGAGRVPRRQRRWAISASPTTWRTRTS